MRIQKVAAPVFITLSLLLTACSGSLSTSASGTRTVSSPIIVVATVHVTSAVKIVRVQTPLPIPTAYASNGITVSVDLNSFTGAPVWLSHNQTLVVVPAVDFGSYGWNVVFDGQFLQLDSRIDAIHPLATGWIWTPKQVGQTQIDISEIPDPCHQVTPPCLMPIYGVTLNIKIIN